MSDLLKEIQEEIERERWLALWQRYGRYVIMAAIAIVVVVIIQATWKTYRYARSEEYTTEIMNAVRNPNAKAFEEAAKKTGGVHQGIAELIHAQLLIAEGKDKEVQALLKSLAAGGKDMPSELARALTAHGAVMDERHSAFYATVLEQGAWAAIEAKEYDAAVKALKALEQVDTAPESMKERAKSALAFIQTQQAAHSKE